MMKRVPLLRVGLGLALLVPLLIAAVMLRVPASASSEEAAVRVPLAAPMQVIEAATGEESAALDAVGDSAQLINAGLPFADGPNPAARGFSGISRGSESYARAHLCLTQAIYYEAGFEPMQGRRAVAQVVLNRAAHPAFPASVCGVVYEGAKKRVCQFSFTCDGSLDRRPAAAAWARAKELAAEALAGKVEPSVGMATHYHADYVAPKWAPMLAKTVKIGAHIFYRWPGQWGRPVAFSDRYRGEPLSLAALQRSAPVAEAIVEEMVEAAPIPFPTVKEDPTIRRAANDVGGLVDVSKGWRPSLPDPTQRSAAERVAAAQANAAPVTSSAATVSGAQQ